jgi:hypothetical protein
VNNRKKLTGLGLFSHHQDASFDASSNFSGPTSPLHNDAGISSTSPLGSSVLTGSNKAHGCQKRAGFRMPSPVSSARGRLSKRRSNYVLTASSPLSHRAGVWSEPYKDYRGIGEQELLVSATPANAAPSGTFVDHNAAPTLRLCFPLPVSLPERSPDGMHQVQRRWNWTGGSWSWLPRPLPSSHHLPTLKHPSALECQSTTGWLPSLTV